MEAEEKTRARKTHRASRRKSIQDYLHVFVEVESWDHYYEFGPGDLRFDELPYRHTETLTWAGRVIYPEHFRYPRAVVTLSASPGLLAPDAKIRPIGHIYARSALLNAYVFVPAEHMSQLVGVAASGRIRQITFLGDPIYRSRALIRRVNLTTEVEE